MLGLNSTSTLVAHFGSSPGEREKRIRIFYFETVFGQHNHFNLQTGILHKH